MESLDIKTYADEVREVCRVMEWKKDWSAGGNYIFLETAEFVEALRGKGDPVEELGDVLFTIIAVADYYGIDILEGIAANRAKQQQRVEEKLAQSL